MAYQLYRNTTLGHTLQESIEILIQNGMMSPSLALKTLQSFDEAINECLSKKAKNRITFKARLHTYRFCDNVWTLLMKNAEIRENQDTVPVDTLKIVACDGRSLKE
ncbi:transcription initiation factor IIA subunit 2-like [Watersipora subatra]|uniref:transcription initiation factor IIA subunit 2-like n=1 Tax=Watersipora subatra TaxID=2589382 RepID=UPI00355C8D07